MNIIETILIALIGILAGFIIGMSGEGKKKSINRVHFYVARNKNDELFLYMGKPFRGIDRFHPHKNGCIVTSDNYFFNFGLNKDDYSNLKWEDKPVEVFVNTED